MLRKPYRNIIIIFIITSIIIWLGYGLISYTFFNASPVAIIRPEMNYDLLIRCFGLLMDFLVILFITLNNNEFFYIVSKYGKLKHQSLKQTNDNLLNLIQKSFDAVIVLNNQGVSVYANQKAENITGYAFSELKQFKLKNLIYPNDIKSLASRYSNIDLINPDYFETVIMNKKRELIPVDLGIIEIFWNGELMDALYFHDITERKKSENALKYSEETAHAILNASTSVILMLNPKGEIILINQVGINTLNVPNTKMIGTNIMDYLDTNEHSINFNLLDDMILHKKSIRYEMKFRDIILDVSSYPIFNKYEEVDRIAIFASDITQQKRLKKEIIEISERERISIGHDLHDGIGQYFTGIGFLTQSVKEKIKTTHPDEAKMLEEISGFLVEAKNQVRLLSKGLYPVHTDKNGLVIAVKELCFRTNKLYSIIFNFKYNDDFKIIDNTIATHLYYIIKEAINNCVKHANATEIVISFNQINSLPDSIIIADNGIGFDLTQNYSGLGLQIMQYRAEIIGADFSIEENNPTGTVITVKLNHIF